MEKEDSGNRNKDNFNPNPWSQQPNKPPTDKEKDMRIWGIILFGLIGAAATTAAVSSSITGIYLHFQLF